MSYGNQIKSIGRHNYLDNEISDTEVAHDDPTALAVPQEVT
jgi:hypothetical protein